MYVNKFKMKSFVIVLLFFVFGLITANTRNIVFILDYHIKDCVTVPTELQVYKGDTVHLHVYWHNYVHINQVGCSINSKELKIKQDNGNNQIKTINFTIPNVSENFTGSWRCSYKFMETRNFCEIPVNVIAANTISDHNLYIIIGVIGSILIIIIISLSVIICYLKSKKPSRLERASKERCDYTVRYSTMPGERKISKKKKGSCIYESMESINNTDTNSLTIKERGRQPLPEEEEHIYDGKVTPSNKLFSVIPARLDSKPNNPPVEDIEYENPEPVEIQWPKNKHTNINCPNPLMMRELGSLLKQKTGAPTGSNRSPSPQSPAPHNLRQNPPPVTRPKPEVKPKLNQPKPRPDCLQAASPRPGRVPLGLRPPFPNQLPMDQNAVPSSLRRPEMDSSYNSDNSDTDWEYETLPNYNNYENIPK